MSASRLIPNKKALTSVTIDVGRLEDSAYCLVAVAVKQLQDRFVCYDPELPFKVRAVCQYDDRAPEALGQVVVEIDMQDKNFSCSDTAIAMEVRSRKDVSPVATGRFRALEQVMRAAQFC
ncbi:hypothetical protein LTR36_003271 [Oleoguttula mirabilis]|uniref:Uncharacterized protein n=1 Tax=Oleoguttula mirabilis TaxID=1507867 RepID=A0AAV9JXC1_9PEZI|nr:hypothetical protein LTR36_003271 [Oleoguttula mirabilis]